MDGFGSVGKRLEMGRDPRKTWPRHVASLPPTQRPSRVRSLRAAPQLHAGRPGAARDPDGGQPSGEGPRVDAGGAAVPAPAARARADRRGHALLPVLGDAFDRIGATLERVEQKHLHAVVTVGTVGTFATGLLLPRLGAFRQDHPHIDLRVMTNNNRVDVAGDGLDYAIRFGNGAWHATDATPLCDAPLSPACPPGLARRLRSPADLLGEPLLRSYRDDEWARWFARAGLSAPAIRGPVFDSSITLAEAVSVGAGRRLAAHMHVRARQGGWAAGLAVRHRNRRRLLLAHPAQVATHDPGHGRIPVMAPAMHRAGPCVAARGAQAQTSSLRLRRRLGAEPHQPRSGIPLPVPERQHPFALAWRSPCCTDGADRTTKVRRTDGRR